jgi:thiol-disulfide isomerase/thioredoxin
MLNESQAESSASSTLRQVMESRRRRFILGAAAAIAGVAGAGLAWRRYQPHALEAGVEGSFWMQQFDTLEQTPLVMQSFKGRPLVLNFWATWCPPCVEELPLLDAFYRQNSTKGWNVIGLAVDQADAVRTFLRKAPLQFPVALAGLSGTSLSKSLGNLTGALPFTVVFDADGAVAHRKMGLVTTDDLAKWLQVG